jgi:hypothetical protein
MQKQQETEASASLRLCRVSRPPAGYCGFHVTRTAWDPYPWVSAVEAGSAAEAAGLQAGDCVLEVNGEDVLGQKVRDVACRVRARPDGVTLLLWNAGSDPHTAASSVSTWPGSTELFAHVGNYGTRLRSLRVSPEPDKSNPLALIPFL